MTAQLHFDGFYYDGPAEWEDWHAGVRMHGTRFHFTRYYATGDYLYCYRDHEFDFWEFTQSVTPELFADAKRDRAPRIGDGDPLCTAGTYSIEGDILTRALAPDWTGDMSWESQCQILEDRLILLTPNGAGSVSHFQPRSGS